jgi:hypothetical protein
MVFLLCFGMGITRPGTTVVTGRVFRGLLPVETALPVQRVATGRKMWWERCSADSLDAFLDPVLGHWLTRSIESAAC